jgi:hypothetical protein
LFIWNFYGIVPWLPESSRWLIAYGSENDAFDIMTDLERQDPSGPFIFTLHKEIIWANHRHIGCIIF